METSVQGMWQDVSALGRRMASWWRWSDPRLRGSERKALRLEQQGFVIRTQPLFVLANIVNLLIVSTVSLAYVAWEHVLAWGAPILLLCAFALLTWWRLKSKPASHSSYTPVLPWAIGLTALLGLQWGLAAIFLVDASQFDLHLFIIFTIIVMMASTTTILNPLPHACCAFIFLAPFPAMVMALSTAGTVEIAVASALTVYIVGLCISTRVGYMRFSNLVVTRNLLAEAREDLVDAIEWTPNAFALFSPDGKTVISNSAYRTFFPNNAAIGEEEFIRERQLSDSRWVRSSQRRTSRGGMVSVHVDISTMKEREEELRSARDQADSANRSKSEFLAMMSHELRTPLNAVIGFSQLLSTDKETASDPARVREYSNAITESGNHLLQVINDILDLSKIEAGRYELFEDEVDIASVVNGTARLLEQKALASDLDFYYELPEGLPALKADERAIRQMLLNLLSNAIKFTPRGGQITVNVSRHKDGRLAINVKDTGIGIAQEDMPRVLAAFGQVQNNLNRDSQGTGLGIPLVCRLIELHEGELVIDSVVGEGTTVHLIFPANRVIRQSTAAA
jgi:signal transduction histidine kinase